MIIGLTGSFGSGKSTIAGFFQSFGAKVVDADRIARNLILPGRVCYGEIVKYFGKGILNSRGNISRKKLSGIVFTDNKLLARLNKIVHPQVIKVIRKEIQRAAGKIIILDVPLLFESHLDKLADKIIVVKLDKRKQINRLLKKTSLNEDDILRRISAQMSLSEKLRRADFIIDNNRTTREAKKEVEKIWRLLWKK